MPWTLDARIPLLTVPDAAALAAALGQGGPAAVLAVGGDGPVPPGAVASASFELAGPAHAPACTCCAGRGPAAAALDRLFQARVRNACPWFERVVALAESPEARAEIAAALAGDAVTMARFKAG